MRISLSSALGISLLVTVALLLTSPNPTVAWQDRDTILPAGSRSLDTFEGHNLALRAVVVPRLSQESGEAIARRFVASTAHSSFAELVMGTGEADVRKAYYGAEPKPEAEPSYCDTLGQIGAVSALPRTPAARLISLNGNALYTYRSAGLGNTKSAGVTELLLAGSRDPTKFEVNGASYRLLRVGVKQSSKDELSGVLFFKSSAVPSCSECRELVNDFQGWVGGRDWEVEVRRDVWFANPLFPLVFRFEPDNAPVTYSNWHDTIVPPSPAQYYRSPHLTCRSYYGKFSCEAYGAYERIP